jgi:hypothetical protein
MDACLQLVMSEGTQVDQVDTHRREQFEEDRKNMAGKNYQEIRGSALNDIVEKVRHARKIRHSSMFGRMYNNEESRGIFDGETVGHRDVGIKKIESNAPYTSERAAKVISPNRHRWKTQNWYSSRGMSGTTVAFGIRLSLRRFLQRPAKQEGFTRSKCKDD